jgi:hypothetical protein
MYRRATSVFFALLQGEGQESERLDFCKKNNLLLQLPEKSDTVYTASQEGYDLKRIHARTLTTGMIQAGTLEFGDKDLQKT